MHWPKLFLTKPSMQMHPAVQVGIHAGFPFGLAQVAWQLLFPHSENTSFELHEPEIVFVDTSRYHLFVQKKIKNYSMDRLPE